MCRTNGLWIAIGLSALLGACQRRDVVDDRTPFLLANEAEWSFATYPSLPLSATDLRELSGRALQNTGRFVAAGDERAPLAARAFAEVLSAETTTQGDQSTVDVRLRFQLVPPLSDDPGGIVAMASGSAHGKPNDAARAAVLAAMGRALEQIAADQHGQSQSNADLVAELSSSDPARVEMALNRLAGRRDAACFAPLVARLHGPDVDTAQQAMAYLVSLNDARAVRPIIEEAEQRGLAFRIEALYALGSLGGDEAEAYLFALTSDPDLRIRSVAAEALSLAKRRNAARAHPAEPVR